MANLLIPRREIWTHNHKRTLRCTGILGARPKANSELWRESNDLVSGKSPVAINRSYAADSKA